MLHNSWPRVLVLIGAGAAVALQIGKVPAALPALQAELGLSLVQSGWVVAIFSVMAASIAVFMGSVSDRFGPLEMVISGMGLSALAGIAGSFSPDGVFLLTTRVFEGLGFILTTTSIPSLIIATASERNRKASLALWGTYMPLGSGIMMALSGPILHYTDWRVLWWITSILILLMAVPVFRAGRHARKQPGTPVSQTRFVEKLASALGRGPLLLATIFAIYASLYLIVASFLPLILIEHNNFTAFSAASVSAVVIFCNVLGNGFSGWLHNHGFRFDRLILIGGFGMAIGGSIVFIGDLAAPARIAAAAGFCFLAGLVPSSLFTESSNHAPHPSIMATVSGILLQGAAIGQLVGPPAAAVLVSWWGGWDAAIPIMISGAILMAACTMALIRKA